MPDNEFEYKATLDDDEILKTLKNIERYAQNTAVAANRSFDKMEKSGEKAAKKIDKDFKKSFDGVISKSQGLALALAGSFAGGVAAVKRLTDETIALDTAQTNLAISAGAANREFGAAVGTGDEWAATVKRLRDELKIYSEQELNEATVRLIDMSKRLGLSATQMEEVLRRTADLSAGKVDLQSGIERVTSALRGEAESAEFLGLSLNEDAVRRYAESHGLVWAQLTETQKAQERYNLFLAQTNELQGRAAVYAQTLAGQEQILNAQLKDQSAILGKELLPLRQGYAELLKSLASDSEQSAGIITKFFAALTATILTFTTVVLSALQPLKVQIYATWAALQAVTKFQDPLEAFIQATKAGGDELAYAKDVLTDIPGFFMKTYEELKKGFLDQQQGSKDAAEALAGLGDTAQTVTPDLSGLTDQVDELGKALEDIGDIEADLANTLLEIAIKGEQDRIEALLDGANQRVDIARKNAGEIADIFRDAGRDARDSDIEANRDREDLDIDTANKLVDIEVEYRRKIQDIQRQFRASAEEAERTRDAVAFLQAQRQRDRDIQAAGVDRARDIKDTQADAQKKREELARDQEREKEDARQALEDKLEDQRIANERELQEQAIKEQRKLEEQQRQEQQQREAAQRASQRKLEELLNGLSAELQATLEYEGSKTAITIQEAQRRIEALQAELEARQEIAAQMAAANAAAQSAQSGIGSAPSTSGGAPAPVSQFPTQIPMFQHGGMFRVRPGGLGGIDSQLVQFRATPGETVSVMPPGITSPFIRPDITNAVSSIVNNMPTINQSMLDPAAQNAVMRQIAYNQAVKVVKEVLRG